jgi:Tfp pilus assembly protein PilE
LQIIDRTQTRGTLLLDTLTALAILAVVFAVSYPNYIRAMYEAQIQTEAAQFQILAAATAEYANDHHGTYPPSAGYPLVSTSLAGTSYITTIPTPAADTISSFSYSPNPDDGALYEIIDGIPINGNPADPANNLTYYVGTYVRHDGTACQSGDYLAIDNVHGVHCTQPGH